MESPHRRLDAWKVSMDMVTAVYAVTKDFPSEEKFGLISQMRRAAVSVPSNIAEGAADRTKDQFSYHLSVAIGSLAEIDTQLEIARRLNFVDINNFEELARQISRSKALIFGLKKSLK